MRPLFRPEVIEAQARQGLGTVRLVQPPSLRLLVAGAALLALALGVAAYRVPYARTATADGFLIDPSTAELGVPAAAVSAWRPDQAARLHFEVLPARAGGHVGAQVVQVARTPRDDGLYAARLRLASPPAGLEPGMRVHAVVTLERGRLVDLLFGAR